MLPIICSLDLYGIFFKKYKTTVMNKIQLSLIIILSLIIFSCKKVDLQIASGNVIDAKGVAFTRYFSDKLGHPEQLILIVNDSRFNKKGEFVNVPAATFIFDIPKNAKEQTVFDHIEVDWNPYGHPPAGVYDLPHFDLHFYMVTKEEVLATTDMAIMAIPVPSEYLPAHYVQGPSIPKMGTHWIDITSSEFPPIPGNSNFTQTFIYGSNDGKITFYESMITKHFLETTTFFERQIPQPEKFQKDGYFPTHMIIQKIGNLDQIIFDKFIYRQKS